MPQTIVALATPAGRSGIGVIRLSGETSYDIVRRLIGDPRFDPEPRKTFLRRLVDRESAEAIDEALITCFRAPHSFTGENVAEISCHGSPVLLRQVIDECLGLGARLAEPGEFTLRALASGRIDLSEAEGIRDLIDARTIGSARLALRQLGGEFSLLLQPIKDELLDTIVILESALEFVEDDLPETQSDLLGQRLAGLTAGILEMAATYSTGRLIRDGLRVAIVGQPNVGKSSLFNRLLGTDRAIVTDIAGTTRDQLNEQVIIDGIPVSLVDTAGLRQTEDLVESIGVGRSRAVMADADLVMVMIDASASGLAEDDAIIESVDALEHLVVLNKIDKVSPGGVDSARTALSGSGSRVVAVSAKTGDGFNDLRSAITETFRSEGSSDRGFLVTDARHHDLLTRAAAEIETSLGLFREGISEEIVLVGLHNALRYLGQITGETTTEDMLTRIFSTFCIGK